MVSANDIKILITLKNGTSKGLKQIKLLKLYTYCLINVSCHEELHSGIFLQASAEALIKKSFTDNFTFSFDNIEFNSLRNLSIIIII